MINLSARDKATLLAGAAVMTTLIAGGRGAPAILAWRASELSRASAVGTQAQEARELIGAEGQIHFLLAERERDFVTLGSALLQGTTDARLSSEFVQAIREASDGAGFQVSSIAVRHDSVQAELQLVTADVRGSGGAVALAGFLAALESDFPIIAVRSLSTSATDAAIAEGQEESVRAQLVLEALATRTGGSGAVGQPAINVLAVPPLHVYDRDSLFQVTDIVGMRNPFRMKQFNDANPRLAALGPYVPMLQSRATPVLKGVLGGPPWRVVIGGLPGYESGVVLAPGDTIAGMKLRSVTRETAILVGKDTVHTLRLQASP